MVAVAIDGHDHTFQEQPRDRLAVFGCRGGRMPQRRQIFR